MKRRRLNNNMILITKCNDDDEEKKNSNKDEVDKVDDEKKDDEDKKHDIMAKNIFKHLFFDILDASSVSVPTNTENNDDDEGSLSEIEEEPELDEYDIEEIDISDFGDLKTLDDLISLSEFMQDKTTNIKELNVIKKMLPELLQLKNLIGLDSVKNAICSQILFYSQKLHSDEMFPHTMICGPPGCGKTTLSKILGRIYLKMGFLKNNKFVIAKRSDLIGRYLGQTAPKTQAKIDEAKGGVLFIDEAYSLGFVRGDMDSYSKECIDTLNYNLSERRDFICIIAGYRKELEENFFSRNIGLKRRFVWSYSIKTYSAKELCLIFLKKLGEDEWELENENTINEKFFDKNKKFFTHFGGSIELFFQKVKISHSRRVFGKSDKRKLNKDDIKYGFEIFKEHEEEKRGERTEAPFGMYL